MTPLLSVQGVSWRAGDRVVLERIALDVAAGERIALMGRNGAGKSTLVDIIAGLRRPAAGKIDLDGKPLDRWTPGARARIIAHLPQSVRGDLPFPAEQLVLMGRYPHADRWFESEADRLAIENAMRRTSCLEFRSRRVSTLSGGERQRVLLAACLAQQPKLLLLDEPSTFLDVDQQLHCFNVLREESARGTASIAVTHDINLALTFCTRLVVLADRTVAFDVPVAEATASTEWLKLFSAQLTLRTTPEGRPWVSYA